jgi:hypothetical protein
LINGEEVVLLDYLANIFRVCVWGGISWRDITETWGLLNKIGK